MNRNPQDYVTEAAIRTIGLARMLTPGATSAEQWPDHVTVRLWGGEWGGVHGEAVYIGDTVREGVLIGWIESRYVKFGSFFCAAGITPRDGVDPNLPHATTEAAAAYLIRKYRGE